MKTIRTTLAATVALLCLAQPAGAAPGEPASLSGQQVEGYLAGQGMGMARPAELNGYPGPKHVLELAAELDLSATQRERTEALYAAMSEDARRLGAELVDAERRLDRLFADRLAERDSLRPLLDRISSLQGSLRAVHLETHLAQRALLDAGQLARYAELRASMRGAPHAPMPQPMHDGAGGHACPGGEDHEAMHRRHHPEEAAR